MNKSIFAYKQFLILSPNLPDYNGTKTNQDDILSFLFIISSSMKFNMI